METTPAFNARHMMRFHVSNYENRQWLPALSFYRQEVQELIGFLHGISRTAKQESVREQARTFLGQLERLHTQFSGIQNELLCEAWGCPETGYAAEESMFSESEYSAHLRMGQRFNAAEEAFIRLKQECFRFLHSVA